MNLSQPADLRRFLSKYGIQAEKSLGQHFLCSEVVVDSICCRVQSMAGIMEIGPGPGILTSRLAQWDRKLVAIELDGKMLPALFESAPYADVLHQDALKSDFAKILGDLPTPRAIVGNLPYYITGALINQIAQVSPLFEVAILMMQKEVADRLNAAPGDADRGSISVYLQSRFEISIVAQVPPTDFIPPPKVKSTVLQLRPKMVQIPQEEDFFRFVKIGFAQPRKTLANNLSSGLKLGRSEITSAITNSALRPDIRPHFLSQEDWQTLHQMILNLYATDH